MAGKEKDLLENIGEQEYKYGFTSQIETETIGKGLSEEVVRLISAKKGEPAWMTERRVAAYRHWLTLEPPTWAHLTIPEIDFQDIIYYAAPKARKKLGSMDEVDPELKRTFDKLGLDRAGILGITMPGFGTTDRTYRNALELMRGLGVTVREIPIRDACMQHFRDIGLDPEDRSAAYENSQARERTQILMDVANMEGGLVIGTGDLSELALGWATYNGDHMSMYGVNAGVPKTLVRYLVQYEAETAATAALHDVLLDILDTPVSPELLPAKDGEIAQITEDLVGPYELHDFYLYYVLRCGFGPAKIYRLAKAAFAGRAEYTDAVLYKWLRNFYWRFFAQQFKRSCLPDGPKVGSVTLSPRGDWRMPSDACATLWLAELEQLKPGEQ